MQRVGLLPTFSALCAVLVLWGSTGKWATALLLIDVRGTDVVGGRLTFALGLGCLVLAISAVARPARARLLGIAQVMMFAVVALVGGAVWSDLHRVTGAPSGLAQVGWGLELLTVAAVGGFLLSLCQSAG